MYFFQCKDLSSLFICGQINLSKRTCSQYGTNPIFSSDQVVGKNSTHFFILNLSYKSKSTGIEKRVNTSKDEKVWY